MHGTQSAIPDDHQYYSFKSITDGCNPVSSDMDHDDTREEITHGITYDGAHDTDHDTTDVITAQGHKNDTMLATDDRTPHILEDNGTLRLPGITDNCSTHCEIMHGITDDRWHSTGYHPDNVTTEPSHTHNAALITDDEIPHGITDEDTRHADDVANHGITNADLTTETASITDHESPRDITDEDTRHADNGADDDITETSLAMDSLKPHVTHGHPSRSSAITECGITHDKSTLGITDNHSHDTTPCSTGITDDHDITEGSVDDNTHDTGIRTECISTQDNHTLSCAPSHDITRDEIPHGITGSSKHARNCSANDVITEIPLNTTEDDIHNKGDYGTNVVTIPAHLSAAMRGVR